MAPTPEAAAPRYIDVHHHCVLPEYQAALVRAGAADPSKPLRKNASPQEAIDSMGTLGIEAAIVNPLSVAGVHHGDDQHARYLCSTVGEALARFSGAAPDKLGFFAPLPFPDIDGSLEQMAYALDTLKADGLILLSNQNGIYVGDKRMEPLLAEMNRRKAVVLVHPARPTFIDDLTTQIWGAIIEYTFETTRVAAYLIYNEFMKRYPDIRWILAHAGGCLPYVSFRLILMEERDINTPAFATRVPEGARQWIDRFYFDTAISGSRPALSALMEVARPGHVFYGSDWPYLDRHTVELQHECLASWDGFTPQTRAAVYRDSALALFPRFRKN